MGVKGKQRHVIEFLLLEECTGAEIVIRVRNANGSAVYCRTSVLKWISEVCGGNEERRIFLNGFDHDSVWFQKSF
jgi:hypothetical protein